MEMEYVRLGSTGLRVSRLGLGAACFGDPLGEAESLEVLRHAFDHGVNFVDTANAYGQGRSETIVGKAIAGRDDIVISTKVFGRMGDGPNDRGSSRKHIVEQAEASLRRLGVEAIDLYQLHQPDPETPIEESLRALDDLVRAGKIRYAGCSNFYPVQLSDALWATRRLATAPISSEQVPYSLLDRRVEQELIPYCSREGVGLIAYTPLAQGILGGRYRPGAPPDDSRCTRSDLWRHWYGQIPEHGFAAFERLATLAGDLAVPLPRLAIAWVLRADPILTTLVGPRTPAQLDDLTAALDLRLDAESLERIDEIVPAGGFLWF